MKNLIRNAVLLSVYHIAKETATNLEKQMKEEDKDQREVKSKMTVIGTVQALLGILYND
jgi:hypothetical protein